MGKLIEIEKTVTQVHQFSGRAENAFDALNRYLRESGAEVLDFHMCQITGGFALAIMVKEKIRIEEKINRSIGGEEQIHVNTGINRGTDD